MKANPGFRVRFNPPSLRVSSTVSSNLLDREVTLRFFRVRESAKENESLRVEMSPDEAEELANDLLDAARAARKGA